MVGKKVIFITNMYPSMIESKKEKMKSQGMILYARDPSTNKMELLVPPEESIIGERVGVDG